MDMTIFHGLKLLTSCGVGAYGEVYYCEDLSGRKMAVKIVSKKKFGDSWKRELRGVINYRKITEHASALLQIFHVGEDEETFYYTMEAADSATENEYVPDTLAYRLQSGALPQTELFRILSGVFEGIKLIHHAGFTHRDIKPDNILFVKGVPKLADIGLVSSLSNSMTQLAGTLDFIPPEERTADALESSDRHARQRNDLYAFGKVIYCAVTGRNPHEYPAVPPDMPLSLPLKYFLRLSYDLCNNEPVRRLTSISRLEQEFADIERKVFYGETFRDKLIYAGKRFAVGTKTFFFMAWRLLKRYWYLMVLFLLIGGGTAYWIWKPDPPFDITQQKSKRYFNASHQLEMMVPFHWEIISKETMQQLMKEAYQDKKNNPHFTEKQIESFSQVVKHGQDMIYCDFGSDFADNIVIAVFPMTRKEMDAISEDEFRLMLKGLFEGRLDFKTEIFASRKMTLSGHPAIFLDYRYMPAFRACCYWIALESKTVMITLSAKNQTFLQRQEEFSSVIKTLKIGK